MKQKKCSGKRKHKKDNETLAADVQRLVGSGHCMIHFKWRIIA